MTVINATQLPILKQEIATVEKYTDNGIIAKAQRTKEFILANPSNVTMRVVTGSIKGGLIGGAIGAAAFGLPCAYISPSNAKEAAKFGAATGMAIGMYLGAKEEYRIVKYPQVFANWKKDAIAKNVYPIFEKYVAAQAQNFQCPLTLTLISNPVRDPHGCCFEREEIDKNFDKGNGKFICPQTQQLLTRRDVVFDLHYHERLHAALKPAFATAVQDPVIVEAANVLGAQTKEAKAMRAAAPVQNELAALADCKNQAEREQILQIMLAKLKNPEPVSDADSDSKKDN